MNNGDWIGISIVASRYLALTPRRIAQMCISGHFKTAHKPGAGKRSHWKISRAEVEAYRLSGHKRELA